MAARPPLLLGILVLLAAAAPVDSAVETRLQAAAQVRQADEAVSDAAQRVVALEAQRQAAQARLQERAATLAPLLPLAERLGMYPAETLLAVPVPAEQAVRGLAVLQSLTRTLETQAAAVRAEIAAVEQARRELDAALPALRSAQAEQRLRAAQLDRQIEQARAERARADDAAADEARRAAAEATRAESVTAALDTMAQARARAEQQLQRDAERAAAQRRTVALMLAQKRAAEVSAPRGPGIQPGGGAMLPVAGADRPSLGRVDGVGAGARDGVPGAAERAGGVALRWSGGVRGAIPQLRRAGDPRLRREISLRLGRTRAARRGCRHGGPAGRSGRLHAGLGPGGQRPPAGSLRRIATRWRSCRPCPLSKTRVVTISVAMFTGLTSVNHVTKR